MSGSEILNNAITNMGSGMSWAITAFCVMIAVGLIARAINIANQMSARLDHEKNMKQVEYQFELQKAAEQRKYLEVQANSLNPKRGLSHQSGEG